PTPNESAGLNKQAASGEPAPANDSTAAKESAGSAGTAALDPIAELYRAANRSVVLPTEEAVPVEAVGSGAHRVLVVDDEPDMRRCVVSALSRAHEVLQAADGPTGLELARQKHPDLVLLDVMLPGMDGLDVCRALKGDAATRNM